MRPRCCLRCLTFLGINMSVTVPGAEVGGLVVLARAALDLLLLGEEALELGIGLLDEGLGLDRGVALGADGRAGERPPSWSTTRRGAPAPPEVSPTAMAASRLILSSLALLYGRMSPL